MATMAGNHWVLMNRVNKYWSNERGWTVSFLEADIFTQKERENFEIDARIPFGPWRWIKYTLRWPLTRI